MNNKILHKSGGLIKKKEEGTWKNGGEKNLKHVAVKVVNMNFMLVDQQRRLKDLTKKRYSVVPLHM